MSVGLVNVRLVCTAGASTQRTILQLEVDGVLIAKSIHVMPRYAGDRINLVLRIGTVLPPNSELRVKCVSGPSNSADAIRAIGLNLYADEASTVVTPAGEMYVRWVNQAENLRLLEYNPSTHLFTESAAGISSGRATLENATTFAATIQGALAARCDATQAFKCNEIVCTGGVATSESPRLEFFIGKLRIATLTRTGVLYVLDVLETATVNSGADRFCLFGNGIISATIGPTVDSGSNILAAVECIEPV